MALLYLGIRIDHCAVLWQVRTQVNSALSPSNTLYTTAGID